MDFLLRMQNYGTARTRTALNLSASCGVTPQLCSVAEHLAQGDLSPNNGYVARNFMSSDTAFPLLQARKDGAHCLSRSHDLCWVRRAGQHGKAGRSGGGGHSRIPRGFPTAQTRDGPFGKKKLKKEKPSVTLTK